METEKMIVEMSKFSSEDITLIITFAVISFFVFATIATVLTIKDKTQRQ